MSLISSAKCELSQLIAKLQKIKSIESNLEENINNFNDAEWQTQLADVECDKQLINQILTKHETTSTSLKYALKKRKQKRAATKQRKSSKKILPDVVKLPISSTRKKSQLSEQILCGINKKKMEAQNYIDLFDSIKRLNEVKQTKLGCASMDDESLQKISDLKSVWMDSLDNYNLEEIELQRLVNETKSTEDQWYEVLFGQDSPNFESRQMGLNKFIKRRRFWDLFINKGGEGSSIPVEWVLPNENASESWAQYLRK